MRSLQQALVNAGIQLAGGVDGIFGPATEAAVKTYQRSRGLPVTGRGDAATLNALGRGAPTSTTPSTPSNVLARGSRGDSVRRLQLALMQAGIFVPGGADGIFGPATESALKTYQRRKGLSATGRVDGATAAALGLGGGTPSTSGYVGLRLGSRGTAVQAVQRGIMRSGIRLFGGADGVFGMATQSALMLFQRAHGIPASGVVDAATVRAMGLGGGTSGGGSPGGGSPGGSTAPGYAGYNERGARVVALQQALVRAGVRLCGGVDGDFGSCTASAVMQFQRSRGLPATGRVDQATADRLGLRSAPGADREPTGDRSPPGRAGRTTLLVLRHLGRPAGLGAGASRRGHHRHPGAEGVRRVQRPDHPDLPETPAIRSPATGSSSPARTAPTSSTPTSPGSRRGSAWAHR